MGKVMVQFDAITIRPRISTDDLMEVYLDIIYKLNGEEIYKVENQKLGEGLDVNMRVEFEITPTPQHVRLGKQ